MNTKILLSYLVIFASCSVNYRLQVNRFETPEVQGEALKGKVAIHTSAQEEIAITKLYDNSAIPLGGEVDTEASIKNTFGPGLNLNLGLHPKIDLYAHTQYDAPAFLGFKYQFLGDGENQGTTGFKASIAAAMGYAKAQDTNEIENSLSGNKESYDSKLALTSYELSFLFGHRFSKDYLAYGNAYWSKYQTSIDHSQNGILKYMTEENAENIGLLLGVKIGEKKFFKLETGIAQGSWGLTHQYTVPIGINFGMGW